MMQTTFRRLEEAGACKERYLFLAKNLGGIKKYGKDTPITLKQILDINGLDDALWALRACNDAEKFSRLLACDYAERVLSIWEAQYPEDDRPRKAIEVSRKYAMGEATEEDLYVARIVARDAACAAWHAFARIVARDAACAAWHAFTVTTEGATRTAEHAANAARDAVDHAPKYAARDAGWAVYTAAVEGATPAAEHIADAAYAAWNAERTWQEARLRELLERGQE